MNKIQQLKENIYFSKRSLIDLKKAEFKKQIIWVSSAGVIALLNIIFNNDPIPYSLMGLSVILTFIPVFRSQYKVDKMQSTIETMEHDLTILTNQEKNSHYHVPLDIFNINGLKEKEYESF